MEARLNAAEHAEEKFEEHVKSIEDNLEREVCDYPDELECTDPIFEIIEQVGKKYKKTWEELAK
jgi:hypothetical protein